jgi:Ca-activated chloride channel family protein
MGKSRKRKSRRKSRKTTTILGGLIAVLFITIISCCALWAIYEYLLRSETTAVTIPSGPFLTVAYSPEKRELVEELVAAFNDQQFETDDGKKMVVNLVEYEPEEMISAALNGECQAINPDSSIWLDQLDRAWVDQTGDEVPLVGETMRYAVSPVVIAMWEDVARSLGWPDKPIGWQDIMAEAQRNPDFKWSHPSTSSASGLLATLAEFYAGAGKTRGLTVEDAQNQATLDYVASIEKTVRHYGEGEWAVIQQILTEGRSYLDAFVVQEQLVIYFNARSKDKLVAIYPQEGTLWEDHPLALLEMPGLTPTQRLVFRRFSDYLSTTDSQMRVLFHGYRPADLSIPLDDPASPIKPENGVNPAEPQTALQIPSPAVVETIKNIWWYTKRHTNVYLVVDTSGSMRGEALNNAQEALRVFIDQIKGDLERVGLIEFSSGVNNIVYLDELKRNRTDLQVRINSLRADGNTALLDAIDAAYIRLQEQDDKERINAIVAMTDGKENNSRIGLSQLISKMRSGNERGVPVVVFCIAYGSDADYYTLETIANATGGQVRTGDLETIRGLYKILSTYF